MTNLNAMTTDQLFYIIDKLSILKPVLSQAGLDKLNQHLIEIDAELESRRPVGEFRTLYQEMNSDTGQPIFSSFLVPVGFEYLASTLEGDDNWNQWEDYGISPLTFMGQY